MYKYAQYIFLSAALVTFSAATAHAQNVSAQGLSSGALQGSACVEELNRVNDEIDSLENFVGALESCNDQGKIYNGTSCVDLSGLTHQWLPNTNNPTQLVLYSNGVEVKRVNVIKGHDGFSQTSADCPAGTTAQ